MAKQNGDFGAFLRGLLVGGAIGVVIGILKAPQSGDETVALLKQKSSEAKADLENAALDARMRAEEIIADAEAKANEIRDKTEQTISEQLANLEAAAEAGKDAAG